MLLRPQTAAKVPVLTPARPPAPRGPRVRTRSLQRPIMSAVKERLELSKKKLATATTSEGSLKQETDRQSADVRDIEIQLADIAKSERMLEGRARNQRAPSSRRRG